MIIAFGIWLLFVFVFALGYCFGRLDGHLDSALANIRDLQSAGAIRLSCLDRVSSALATIRSQLKEKR